MKKLIILCLTLAVAVLSVPVRADFYFDKTGITDRWMTQAEAQGVYDQYCTCGNQVSWVTTTYDAPKEVTRERVETGSREAWGQSFHCDTDPLNPKLGIISIWGDGGDPNTTYIHTLHLYDITEWAGGECPPPNGDYPRDNDLLGGMKWTYNGFGTKQVVNFVFCDDQAPYLEYCHEYVFEITLEEGDVGSGMYFERLGGGDSELYPCGTIYSAQYVDDERGWLYGYNRNAEMALYYFTPEPATIALLGLGGLALLRRKRA